MDGHIDALFDDEMSIRARTLTAAWLAVHGGEEALETLLFKLETGRRDSWSDDLATETAVAMILRLDSPVAPAPGDAKRPPRATQLDQLSAKALRAEVARVCRLGGGSSSPTEATWARILSFRTAPSVREALCRICGESDPERLAREILAALRSTWREVSTLRQVEARGVLGRHLLFHSRTERPSRPQFHDRLPEVDVLVVGCEGAQADAQTHREGRLRCRHLGLNDYDVHRHWPIEGFAVDKDRIEVLGTDGARTPILSWLAENDILVLCPRCGGIVSERVEAGCPALLLRRRRQEIVRSK
jgi:hypothetical protein